MFQDIGVSKDLNDKFKAHLSNTGPLDCKYIAYDIQWVFPLSIPMAMLITVGKHSV